MLATHLAVEGAGEKADAGEPAVQAEVLVAQYLPSLEAVTAMEAILELTVNPVLCVYGILLQVLPTVFSVHILPNQMAEAEVVQVKYGWVKLM